MWKFIKNNKILILSLIYILSPLDIIPEFLLGPFGLIDDFNLVLALLARAYYNHKKDNRKEREIIDIE